VEVAVGEHKNVLAQGESLHFNSGIRHQQRNISDGQALCWCDI
jgi:quercetin dioxygenase-like cupin family protein